MKTYSKFLVLILLLVATFNTVSASHNYGVSNTLYKERVSTTDYSSRSNQVTTRSLEAYYYNDDRYSTRDYHNGYSYRTSDSYWRTNHKTSFNNPTRHNYYSRDHYNAYHGSSSKKHTLNNRYGHYNKYDDYKRYDNSKYDRYGYEYYESGKDYYYKYNPYKGSYDKKTCYHYPPRGKFFYVKC